MQYTIMYGEEIKQSARARRRLRHHPRPKSHLVLIVVPVTFLALHHLKVTPYPETYT